MPPALLQALLDHIPALAYAKDDNGRWVLFNEFFRQSGRLPANELRGKTDMEVLHPDIVAWIREHDEAVLAAGKLIESEKQTVDADGNPITICSYKNIWTDPDSGRRYILGFILDVTSHRHVEHEHETILNIVENGPATLVRCRVAPGLPIEYISKNIARFSYTPESVYSRFSGFMELIHGEDADRVAESSDQYIREGQDSFVLEYRIIAGNGGVRWVEDYVFIQRDEDGTPCYRQGFLLDVTARHEAVQALAESEQRYRTLAENFPEGSVILFDTNLRFTLAEGRALIGDGLGKDSVVGQTIWEVFEKDVADFLESRYRAALQGRKSLFEVPFMGRHFDVRVVPLRNQQGEITGGMVVSNDITRRKEAENSLADLNANLEKLVAERTQALARQTHELQEANRKLTQLDELKSSFLSSVSHELRTPLTSIFGFTKLIHKDLNNHLRPLIYQFDDACAKRKLDRMLENLSVIEQEGSRLTRLVNDVLDLTRIETGRMEWRDSIIKMDDCIYEAVLAVSGQFFENDALQLEAEVPNDLPDVYADPDRIIQVVVNLLSNAAKFTHHGKVRISAKHVEDDIAVFVTDTGVGIDTNEQKQIFDKFHQTQLGDTLYHGTPGSGLGLAICKDIVERYGGRIWVRSRLGSGSIFTFTIPVAKQKKTDAN